MLHYVLNSLSYLYEVQSMLTPLAIFIGGGIGAVGRWALTQLMSHYCPFLPYGIVMCNIIGSFLIGLLYGYFPKPSLLISTLTIGVLGGFTTFSSFALDGMKLIEQHQWFPFFLYITLSVFLGLGACHVGYTLAK